MYETVAASATRIHELPPGQDESEHKLPRENRTMTKETRRAIRSTFTMESHDRELEARFRTMETDAFQLRLGRNNCDPSSKAHAGKPKVRAEDARCMTRTTSHDCELEARFRAMETDAFNCVYGETTVLPQPIPDLRCVRDAGARQPKTKSQKKEHYPAQTKKPEPRTAWVRIQPRP